MKRPGTKIFVILVLFLAAILLLLPFFGPLVFEDTDQAVGLRLEPGPGLLPED